MAALSWDPRALHGPAAKGTHLSGHPSVQGARFRLQCGETMALLMLQYQCSLRQMCSESYSIDLNILK